MFAVQGIYDGKVVVPKGKIPYKGTREVIITFPDIDNNELTEAEKLNALQQLVGIADGNNMTLDDIKAARLARQ
ncbi:MAG: hypothetical protein LBH43_10355 [Treponema sp.]|jgi:hypothetical protein|nr:hypothetical protein [Treponema sp.]